jgi:hypothetical protein
MISLIQKKIIRPGAISRYRRERPKRAFIPLREATSIGIIADLRKPGFAQPVIQFAKSVQRIDRKCHILFLVPDKRKEMNVFDYEKHFPGIPVEIICNEELGIFKIPGKDRIAPFSGKTFDILFYLETEPNFTLEYVFYHSRATMAAGASGLCDSQLDFEIDLNNRKELPYLTENLLKYLQLIQTRQEMKIKPQPYKLF